MQLFLAFIFCRIVFERKHVLQTLCIHANKSLAPKCVCANGHYANLVCFLVFIDCDFCLSLNLCRVLLTATSYSRRLLTLSERTMASMSKLGNENCSIYQRVCCANIIFIFPKPLIMRKFQLV